MTTANNLVQGLLLGGLYAMFATGLSLMFGVMRLVNLAPVLVTFGLSIILQNLLLELFSADSRGLDAGAIEDTSLALGRVNVGWFPLLTLATGAAVLGGLQLLLARTRLGRELRATSDDPEAAQLVGVDHRHAFAVATGLALATVAIAGIFLGIRTTFSPALGPTRLIFAFEAVIIGGLGSLWGTLAGGMVLGVAQTLGAQVSPGWGVLTGHLVFLAVLAFRPSGLFGKPVTT